MKSKMFFTANYLVLAFAFLTFASLFTSCRSVPSKYVCLSEAAPVFPDYSGITLPPNICPLFLYIQPVNGVETEKSVLKCYASNGSDTIFAYGGDELGFKEKEWKSFLQKNMGKSFFIEVFARRNGQWFSYPRIENFIAKEKIDPYLMYRYIQGSYEILNRCCLVERCLEDFSERNLVDNANVEGACLNCHNFNAGDPSTFMFHVRFTHSGTVVAKGGEMEKIQTATRALGSNCIYPSWHPSSKYIAYSVNGVVPLVYSHYKRYMEAIDTISDIVVLDIEKNRLVACPALKTKLYNETHPCWSIDGKWLYFARCKQKNWSDSTLNPFTFADSLDLIQYDLMRARFNEDSLSFSEPEMVVSSAQLGGKSISLPRISPDGRLLMFCAHSSGTFGSWHRDCDLYLAGLDCLKNDSVSWVKNCKELNSPDEADSYHSWSRNSRWVVFASKRIDGFYTRLYIASVDANGKGGKPFMLPVKSPKKYLSELYIYNICELITGPVPVKQKELVNLIRNSKNKQVSYSFAGVLDSTDALSGASLMADPSAKKDGKNKDERHELNKGFQ